MKALFGLGRKNQWLGAVSLCVAFVIGLMLGAWYLNAQQWLQFYGDQRDGLTLFLTQPITETDYQAIHIALEQDFRLTKIREISPETTFTELNQSILPEAELSKIHQNILPITIEAEIRREYYHQTSEIVRKLTAFQGISEIIHEAPQLNFISVISWSLEWLIILLILVVIGGVFLILYFMLREAWRRQQDGLEWLQLAGAPARSIYLPFLMEVGMVMGLSIGMACGLVYTGHQAGWILPFFREIEAIMGQPIRFYAWHELGGIVICFWIGGEGFTYWIVTYWWARLAKH